MPSKLNHINSLYDRVVDKEKFSLLCHELSLLKASSNLLFNNNFKSLAKFIPGEILSSFFPNTKFNFNNQELGIIIFELDEKLVHMNISLYDEQYGIEDLSDMIQLISHYNKSYKGPFFNYKV